MSSPRVASFTALTLVLSACAVGPSYVRPGVTQPTAFHAAPLAAEQTPDRPAPALDRWWTGFDDPELTRLVGLALAQNLDLAQAEARVTQARAQAKAAGAARLPAGQLNAQAAYVRQSTASPLGRVESAFPGYDRDQSLYDLSAGASWEADLFGGLRRGQQAARADYQASKAALAGAALSVAAETADTYVLVRTFQARLAVLEDQSRTQRQLVDLTRLQVSRGIAPRLDVDRAAGALSQVEATIPVLRAGLEAELNALAILIGQEPGALHGEMAVASAIPSPPRIDATAGPASLLRRRPDIMAAERRLAASDARVGVALSDYYPKVTFSGVLGFEAGDVGHVIGSAGFQPQGLIGLRWRLFDFGRVDAEVAAARGARAEALATYRSSILKATGDVENALTALVERERQARILGDGETALARARLAATTAYKAGRVSQVEVLDADAQLLAIRDARVQAQAEATRAAIQGFKALGGGWIA
jgi:NodT family efflux transporter outer membrane factor (OMF) lipoprotein